MTQFDLDKVRRKIEKDKEDERIKIESEEKMKEQVENLADIYIDILEQKQEYVEKSQKSFNQGKEKQEYKELKLVDSQTVPVIKEVHPDPVGSGLLVAGYAVKVAKGGYDKALERMDKVEALADSLDIFRSIKEFKQKRKDKTKTQSKTRVYEKNHQKIKEENKNNEIQKSKSLDEFKRMREKQREKEKEKEKGKTRSF